jgi:hypothetical protein
MKKVIIALCLMLMVAGSFGQTVINRVAFLKNVTFRNDTAYFSNGTDSMMLYVYNDSVRFRCITCTGWEFEPALGFAQYQVLYTDITGHVVNDNSQTFYYSKPAGSDTSLFVNNRIVTGFGALNGQLTGGVGISNIALMAKGYFRYRNGQQANSTYLGGDAFGDITYHKYDTLTLGWGLTGTRKIMGTSNTTTIDSAVIHAWMDAVVIPGDTASILASKDYVFSNALPNSDASGIPEYPDNATAVVAIGTGRLYFTTVLGEHIVKITY